MPQGQPMVLTIQRHGQPLRCRGGKAALLAVDMAHMVLLYNSTIEGVVHTTEELVAKCPLLAEFKAVQSGSVWCTTQSFFQQSTALVDFVLDLHRVFTENDPADLQFLRKVE